MKLYVTSLHLMIINVIFSVQSDRILIDERMIHKIDYSEIKIHQIGDLSL